VRILLISAANDAGSVVPLPLGLACVAAATERARHHVRLLALGLDADCENDVRKAIKQFAPDVIGVSVRNIDDQNMQSPHFLLGSLKQVVAVCRAASSSSVVLGGAGYSIFPESVLAYLGADIDFHSVTLWRDTGSRSRTGHRDASRKAAYARSRRSS
jgi:hypothetical protein